MKEELKFEDVDIGLRIITVDGEVGTVVRIDDIHNVHVQFDSDPDDYGIFCMDDDCDERHEYDVLYRHV